MIVIIVSSIPQQLRGYLARVRDSLWSKVADNIGVGKATN